MSEAKGLSPDIFDVAIVGSGFGGLCMAIALQREGIDNFIILEKDEDFGGTWRVNDYPGAACDVASHLYSFSFFQNPEWTRRFPPRDEIWEYTRSVVHHFRLAPKIRLSTELEGAEYDEATGLWTLATSRGIMRARIVVLAVGALSRPAFPAIAGLDRFKGTVFHSARWNHAYDLTGKRVAVIGTGASAIQFVPEIAGKVARLDLYQRTPPWILPRRDRAITRPERWLLRHVKALQWLYRGWQYLQWEWRYIGFSSMPWLIRAMQAMALRHLRRQIPDDAELRRKLTPDYALGCKRVLLTNDYYPALTRPNVELLTCGIEAIGEDGITGRDGVVRPVDAIIFGTGFDVAESWTGFDIRGRGGVSLAETGKDGLEAYKGCAVAGFPNLYLIIGPNTALGHNSIIYMIESSVRYVMGAIRAMRGKGLASLEVKRAAQTRYNAAIQERLKGTVWNSGCKSWYLAGNGKNYTLWPGFTFQYRRITREFDLANYD